MVMLNKLIHQHKTNKVFFKSLIPVAIATGILFYYFGVYPAYIIDN